MTNDGRTRGRGFPVVSLPEATKLVEEAGRHGTSHNIRAFATYLGHKSHTSGPFRRRLAAFRDWDLISVEGERITFTELGRRIAIPPDPSSLSGTIGEVFRQCDIFTEMMDVLARGVPLDREQIANTAVHAVQVSVASKSKFAQSFSESAVFAGLASETSDGRVILESGQQEDQEAAPANVATTALPTDDDEQVKDMSDLLTLSWPFSSGDIVFRIRGTEALPAKAFASIQSVTEELEKLRDALDGERRKDRV